MWCGPGASIPCSRLAAESWSGHTGDFMDFFGRDISRPSDRDFIIATHTQLSAVHICTGVREWLWHSKCDDAANASGAPLSGTAMFTSAMREAPEHPVGLSRSVDHGIGL